MRSIDNYIGEVRRRLKKDDAPLTVMGKAVAGNRFGVLDV